MALILKWDVIADNLPHDIGGGQVVHVGSLKGRVEDIQVWTKEENVDRAFLYRRDVQVIEGAHPFPNDCEVLGTVIISDGNIIYHLIELGSRTP